MNEVYLKNLEILDVRGLQGISINLSESAKKHLILTGKNGSGKTSVLDALAHHLSEMTKKSSFLSSEKRIAFQESELKKERDAHEAENHIYETEKKLKLRRQQHNESRAGTDFCLNIPEGNVYPSFQKGEFILAFYQAERALKTTVSNHIEKPELKHKYTIYESPRTEFHKFLADLKVTVALAESENDKREAQEINLWLKSFQDLLRNILEDSTIELVFLRDTFTFEIQSASKLPFDFNTLSSGYAAVLEIVVDLILRMQQKVKRKFVFDVPGIVLIDEIETHLHLQLQRKIMPLLTTLFPNIQFILSTHSPFILNSMENVVIYDLEQKLLVPDGMGNFSYQGIVEGYFGAKEMSDFMVEKFQKYKELVQQKVISDEDLVEISRLEIVLSEIPDFFALNLTTEFKKMKLEFDRREDILHG